MKRVLSVFTVLIIMLVVWFGEKRKFIQVGENYVTLWKQYDNTSYLIWGKYYGVMSPSDGFIKTNNVNNITIYTTKSLPKVVVYKSDEAVEIKNQTNVINFENYETNANKFHTLFYQSNGHTFKELNKGTHALIIMRKENYVINEFGKKQ